MTDTFPTQSFSKSRRGSVSTPCLVSLPPSSTDKTRAAFASVFGLKTAPLTTFAPTQVGIASFLTNEVLLLIFRHIMDRKSILNCSLVSTYWHGPARLELARIVQDMPFNGQGLLHAIRTRFAHDTFPILSMAVFDKLVSNLSEVYYRSNPETEQVFAPAHAPDLLYNLIWTLLFIDQESRNPHAQPKVTCRYFVRQMQREGAGYPLEYFDKRVLKNIYNDIRTQPLLPAPHMIRALSTGLGSNEEYNEGQDDEDTRVQGQGHTGTSPPSRSHQLSSGSFMNLVGSIKLASFKRISRWWGRVRDASENDNQTGSTSQFEFPTLSSGQVSSEVIDTAMLAPAVVPERPLLSLSAFPQGSTSSLSLRSMFGKSDLSINQSEGSGSLSVLNRGFTTVPHGWHVDGDGLDKVVRFAPATKPSTLGSKFIVLQSADLMVGHEPDD
ncbi:hypothetical protein BGZ81_003188 [Podila clonocystis]|nr:hypothetical protein BGZ81_003188 [Podila clonocystis]